MEDQIITRSIPTDDRAQEDETSFLRAEIESVTTVWERSKTARPLGFAKYLITV